RLEPPCGVCSTVQVGWIRDPAICKLSRWRALFAQPALPAFGRDEPRVARRRCQVEISSRRGRDVISTIEALPITPLPLTELPIRAHEGTATSVSAAALGEEHWPLAVGERARARHRISIRAILRGERTR